MFINWCLTWLRWSNRGREKWWRIIEISKKSKSVREQHVNGVCSRDGWGFCEFWRAKHLGTLFKKINTELGIKVNIYLKWGEEIACGKFIFQLRSYWVIYQKCLHNNASCLQPSFPSLLMSRGSLLHSWGSMLLRSLEVKSSTCKEWEGHYSWKQRTHDPLSRDEAAGCCSRDPWLLGTLVTHVQWRVKIWNLTRHLGWLPKDGFWLLALPTFY